MGTAAWADEARGTAIVRECVREHFRPVLLKSPFALATETGHTPGAPVAVLIHGVDTPTRCAAHGEVDGKANP